MVTEFVETSGKLARDSETSVPTVTLYAKLGLLDFTKASDGRLLFRAGQAERVREIKRKRAKARTQRETA